MYVVILRLLALSLGLWGMVAWWWSVVEALRGLAPIVLVLLGAVALAAGISRIRDDRAAKDEELLADGG